MYKIKRLMALILLVAMVIFVFPVSSVIAANPLTDDEILNLESKGCFDFLWETANSDTESPGYGLCRDRWPGDVGMASVASVGYALTAIPIGVERGWITEQEGYNRALGSINTMIKLQLPQYGYFMYHWVNMETGVRWPGSEISVIDSAIAINGAICAGEYFGGEVKAKAEELYKNVDWSWYVDTDKKQFYMGYSPETGFSGHWDFYAEQLQMYALAAAAPTKPVDPNLDLYNNFTRHEGSYGSLPPFINSWFGSIFTYQYSFGWFDFRNKIDKNGIDWWRNSTLGTLSNMEYSIDKSKEFKTYGPNSWGMTACDGPEKYGGLYGSFPSGFNNDQNLVDGTIAPAGAAGSIVFTPEEVIPVLRNFYENYDGKVWGHYGFVDAFNLDYTKKSADGWFAPDVLGIDKGITLVMIENYRTGLIWDLMNKNKYIQAGLKKLGITSKDTIIADDFEGNNINSGWTDNGDGVYTLSDENVETNSGLGSEKVVYDKDSIIVDDTNSLFSTTLDTAQDFTQKSDFRFAIKTEDGLSLIAKFEDTEGDTIQKQFNLVGNANWQDNLWSITDTDLQSNSAFNLAAVKKILFMAAPGQTTGSGTFYIDDVQLCGNKPMASNVIISGKPYIGQTLKGSYNYYDTRGVTEGTSTFSWYRALDKDGVYDPISGANSKTYTVTDNDVDKYLKLVVTPSTSGDVTGDAAESIPVGKVEVSYPVAKNVTITKAPVDVEDYLDNFDGDRLCSSWLDSGDKVYTITYDSSIKYDGNNSLKVNYDKKGSAWAFLAAGFDRTQDLSSYERLQGKVYGNVSVLIKFENAVGAGIAEKRFDFTGGNTWQDVDWDIKSINGLENTKRILFFFAPGEGTGTGTANFDSFKFVAKNAVDVTTNGTPVLGETLYSSHDFYVVTGDTESGTSIQWRRADTKTGDYVDITGGTSASYTPVQADLGKFLKVEITPKCVNGTNAGIPVLSSPTNEVLATLPGSAPVAENVSIKKFAENSKTYEDFDNLNTWKDGGDGVYTLSTDNTSPGGAIGGCLKADYNKGTNSWSYFVKSLDDVNDFSQYDTFKARVYGGLTSILLKFDTSNGGFEKRIDGIDCSEGWVDLTWDISDIKAQLGDINKIMIFAAPGEENTTGTFYMDDIKFTGVQSGSLAAKILDNFNPNYGWTSDSAEFTIGLDNTIPNSTGGCLKVDYTKVNEWAYFGKTLPGVNDYSQYDTVSVDVYGDLDSVLLKIETIDGTAEQAFTNIDCSSGWKTISWDISGIKSKTADLNKVLVFPIFGQKDVAGTFFMDNIKFSAVQNEVPVEKTLDNFNPNYSWANNADGVYTLSLDNSLPADVNVGSLKVEYSKGSNPWSYFAKTLDAITDYSQFDTVTARVYGLTGDILLKFEKNDNSGAELWFNGIDSGNGWVDLNGDISSIKAQLNDVKRILIFANPGDGYADTTGTFYIDDIKFSDSQSGAVVTKTVSDFGLKEQNAGWQDGGQSVYGLSLDNAAAIGGAGKCLKVDYSKGNNSYPYFSKDIESSQVADFVAADIFRTKVYSAANTSLLIKLETQNGNFEKQFDISETNKWVELNWDISSFKGNLATVQKVVIFAMPGEVEETGTFYIDNMDLITKVPVALSEGDSFKAGDILIGSYDYSDNDGDTEYGTKYRWLVSTSANGLYNPIPGEKSKTYTLKTNVGGMYMKFEVTPGANKEPFKGMTQTSSGFVALKVDAVIQPPVIQPPVIQPPVIQPPVAHVDSNGIIQTEMPKLDPTTGSAKVNISETTINEAIKAGTSDSKEAEPITIIVPKVEGAKAYEVEIPAAFLSKDKEAANQEFELKTDLGSLVLNSNMFNSKDIVNAKTVSLTIEAFDKSALNSASRAVIGDRPVIDLVASVDGKRISWKNNSSPVTASIPYKPNEEELKHPEHIVIWYIDGNGNATAVPNGKYDTATGTVTFKTTHFSTYAIAYVNKSFKDAGEYIWAKTAIEVMASKGILEGNSQEKFNPGVKITRAEFLGWLIQTLGLTAEVDSNFGDIKVTDKYYSEIGIAKKLGITAGTGKNKFSPTTAISRQDLMVLVMKALKCSDKTIAVGSDSDIAKYSDKATISKYAKDSVAALVKAGIILGSGNMINPKDVSTRAQAAVIIYKLYNMK